MSEKIIVVVMRVADGPAAVKSIQVTCSSCGETCWLDEKGLPTLEKHPDHEILCQYCASVHLREGVEMRAIRGDNRDDHGGAVAGRRVRDAAVAEAATG